jgi:parallel beta-helix repeat protein
MNAKIAFEMGIVLVVLVMFTAGVASAATLYVGTGEDYTTIQAAVNAASASDTIIVRDGSYSENVNVNKTLTIESENGSAVTKVEAPVSSKHVFNVTADYVNISGFKVKDATGARQAGIYLAANVDHCNISSNNVTHNYVGIRLNKSSHNTIINNTAISNEGGSGIGVGRSSNYNTVRNNTVTSNTKNGIGVGMRSHHNMIRNNTASNNGDFGIYVNTSSNYTTIRNNTIQDNTDYGVKIRNSYDCNIYYNDFISNNASNAGHQAWDNKGENDNNWDDGVDTGNYWSDLESNPGWDLDEVYSIDGDDNRDNYPSGP